MNRALLIIALSLLQHAPARAEPGFARPSIVHLLPPALQEISGLSAAGAQAVYAHDDEHGIVYLVDLKDGDAIAYFAFASPPIAADFEAIVVDGEIVRMVTSDGLIFEGRLVEGGVADAYAAYNAGISDVCEIEGAASDGADGLLLACKTTKGAKKRSRIAIHHWRGAARFEPAERIIDADVTKAWSALSDERFMPGGLERLTDGSLIVVDAASAGVCILRADGSVERMFRLAPESHPQTEGIAAMPDGSVVFADEGGKGAGRLTVYTALPN
ncbi:MAG: hypothetical protein GC152_07140 [Alphaproteobacteria bacterium]|nr:hypothetical protein [Alphaproteobacteria bacterium]